MAARFGVTFRMKACDAYMVEQARNNPIPASDEALIRSAFKDEYFRQIKDWALIQTDKKRARLMSLVRGLQSTKVRPETARVGVRGCPSKELQIRMTNGVIDFNKSIFGQGERACDPRRALPSAMERDGLFGYAEPRTRAVPETPGKYNGCIVRKLFRPSAVATITARADEYDDMLNQLLLWVEKKTNVYPSSQLDVEAHTDPRVEGRLTKARLSEDHMYAPSHKLPVRAETARKPQERSFHGLVKQGLSSSYRDNYCDDDHKGWASAVPKLTNSCKPPVNQSPIVQFPTVAPIKREVPEWMRRQVQDDRLAGRAVKAIYASKTCL